MTCDPFVFKYLEENEAKDSLSKAAIFSTFFNSMFSPPKHSTVNHHYQTLNCLSTVKVGRKEVMLKLKHLDTGKGADGFDNIPPLVLHHCSLLAEPLTFALFNESLEKSIFL